MNEVRKKLEKLDLFAINYNENECPEIIIIFNNSKNDVKEYIDSVRTSFLKNLEIRSLLNYQFSWKDSNYC